MNLLFNESEISVVAVDGWLQDVYNSQSETPLVQHVEQGAAQLAHSMHFTWLCTKMVGKQSLKVVGKQVERHGGVGKIAADVGGFAVDRALHPIETAQATWDALAWTVGTVGDCVGQIVSHIQNDEGRIINLQQ